MMLMHAFAFQDIDECELESDDCHDEYGTCENTDGNYTCYCKSGFTGNGVICESNELIVQNTLILI